MTFVKEALTKTINCVSELQQANHTSHLNTTTTEGADKVEEMTRKILAAIINTQTESKKSSEQKQIEELTKKLTQLQNRINNNGGGGGGGGSKTGNKKPYWEKMKEKAESREKVYDPDPT